ncbi:PAAR domain-containing protein [Caballeronia sp. LZ008]|uniref:PAAR domain-containing protein n=1 Tax=unclassified Caballeronia TaxID=2646786 RepID=UPI002029434C|nr:MULTISPECIES: PAAR domain-containing protein [unclassified Caballeronia]MDR5798291.1 PAAR domain-containing protein [Caballeronia sp. LZ008]
MKGLVYEGDTASQNGNVLTGSARIELKGRRAARVRAIVSCPTHGDNPIVEGSRRVKDGRVPISRYGDHTQCGAYLIESPSGACVR